MIGGRARSAAGRRAQASTATAMSASRTEVQRRPGLRGASEQNPPPSVGSRAIGYPSPVFERGRLLQLTEVMRGKLIVVYGDIVADRFIYGTPKRISREAPVLILRQYRDDILLGGAGNPINNILP